MDDPQSTTAQVSENLVTGNEQAISRLTQDRNRDEAAARQRQEQLDKLRTATSTQEEKELKPLEDTAGKLEGDLQQLQPPKPTQLPEWKPKPIVDEKDFSNFSMGLIAMALVGGAVSRGNWLGVASSLNGALDGYLKGNQARADREFQDYQTKFKEAQAHDEQAQREFESILNNKQLSINAVLNQIKIAAAKYGREDVRQAAEQKSIDGIWRQVEATDRSIATLSEQNERIAMQLALGNARLKQTGGGEAALNDYGKWFVNQTLLGGNDKFLKELQSRYGGAIAADMFNTVGRELQEAGVDPRTLSEAQINNAVQLSVQRQTATRIAGVERLTRSMQDIQSEVTRLVEKVNGTGMRPVNATFNAIESHLGQDGLQDLTELKTLMSTLGRQYIEAVTMPGSNAQLHATAQEWSENVFDPNMNLYGLQGVLKAMNYEIATTSKALGSTLKDAQSAVTDQGMTLPAPGAQPAAQPPGGQLSDEQLLQKYGVP